MAGSIMLPQNQLLIELIKHQVHEPLEEALQTHCTQDFTNKVQAIREISLTTIDWLRTPRMQMGVALNLSTLT